jgi:hypothetical protein
MNKLGKTKIILYVTLIQFILLPIAGCGGRTANPVASVQPGDASLSCVALRTEMSSVESRVAALIPESKKTAKNVGLGVAGLFLIVPFFFMDTGSAEKAEIEAFRTRYSELQKTHSQKGCDQAVDDGTGPAAGAISTKQSLIELKELFDEELISEAEYQKAREALLSIQ